MSKNCTAISCSHSLVAGIETEGWVSQSSQQQKEPSLKVSQAKHMNCEFELFGMFVPPSALKFMHSSIC